MQILWKGQACFQIIATKGKGEQVRIVIDPYDSSIGLRLPSLETDVGLVTHEHYDHNNTKALRGSPFLIEGPGEYDVKGVFVRGIESFHDANQGKDRGQNTIYMIEAEGIQLCHLGDLGQAELTAEQVEAIGNIDILFIPVGGVYTIAAKEAVKIVGQIEPRYVIPMHYQIPKLKIKLEKVDAFLKGMGIKPEEPQAKFSVKTKDLTGEETRIVILNP